MSIWGANSLDHDYNQMQPPQDKCNQSQGEKGLNVVTPGADLWQVVPRVVPAVAQVGVVVVMLGTSPVQRCAVIEAASISRCHRPPRFILGALLARCGCVA